MGEKTIEGKKRSTKKGAKTSCALFGLPVLCDAYGDEALSKSTAIEEPKNFQVFFDTPSLKEVENEGKRKRF